MGDQAAMLAGQEGHERGVGVGNGGARGRCRKSLWNPVFHGKVGYISSRGDLLPL